METIYTRASTDSVCEKCMLCGEQAAIRSIETQEFGYNKRGEIVVLTAEIPIISCSSCEEMYAAEGAEDAQHNAVCLYLGRLNPDEIRTIRSKFRYSQAGLAKVTGIGIASIKRWESGSLIQSAAHDKQLRLTDIENGKAGGLFTDFLKEQGTFEETNEQAVKRVIAYQLQSDMKTKGITKVAMAEKLNISRSQLDCLLDPENDGVTLSMLSRAAKVLGRKLTVSLQ